MEFRKYKTFDLVVLCILAAISEFFSVYFLDVFNSYFYLSFSMMIGIIAIVRWGIIGSLTYIISGIVNFAVRMNQPEHLEVWQGIINFIFANAFILIPYIFIRKNRNIFAEKPSYIILYIIFSFLSVSIGKGICWIIIYKNADGFFSFFLSEMLSMVVSIVILFLMARKTELLVDMDQYLVDQED